jgi:hypothetical protein
MRTLRLCAIVTLGLALGYGLSEAKEGGSAKAKCCIKAENAGKACDHACCVQAAKAGKNCEKCGGKNKKD